MAIEAPVSKYKKTNLKIYIAFCIGLVIWCVYDGYFNEKFKEKYTGPDGKAKGWLVVNRNAPPYLIGAAVLFSAYLFAIRNKKIVADENELIISGKEKIPYEAIQKIDKTHFRSKLERRTAEREFVGHPQGGLQEIKEEAKEEVEGEPTGYFIITYKDKSGNEVNRKLSDRKYDNLGLILDHLVVKIS